MTNPAFEQTCRHYLEQLARLDLQDLAARIGVETDGDTILLPFFDSLYRVSVRGVVGPDFRDAPIGVKVVLFKYLLMFPKRPPLRMDWVSYRDFPDAAPFAGAFRANVEMTLARVFTGKRPDLLTSCAAVGGLPPASDFGYDACSVFQALPHLDLLLLFNDADEIFPAKSLVLFDKNAGQLLDMECLAGVGWRLAFLLFNMSGFELAEE